MKKIFLAIVSLMVLTASQVYAQFPDPPTLRLEVMRSVTERWGGTGPYSSTFYMRATNTGQSAIGNGIEMTYSVGVSDTQGTTYGGVNSSHTIRSALGPGQSFEFNVSINPGRPFVTGDYIFTVERLTLLDPVNRTQSQTITNLISYRYRVEVQPLPQQPERPLVINLVADHINLRPAAPQPGDNVTIDGLYVNRGDDPVSNVTTRMELFKDGRKISNWPDKQQNARLERGLFDTIRVEKPNIESGSYTARLTVDPDRRITETNETDNVWEARFQVGRAAITVTIEPLGARNAGGQWQLAGGNWNESGTTVRNLAPGRHRVEFKEMPGWFKPDALQANIVSDETLRLTGTYIEKGSLTVTLQPQEANTAGAKWSVDGSAWQDSGATVSNLRLGSQRVQFKSLNDARWIVPEPTNINIASGQTSQATATYHRAPASLSVVILPPELRQAGAQWRVVKGPKAGAWQNSEAVLPVPEGQHQLEFKEVAGWVRPATQDMNIASLQNIQLRGEYRRETGGIQVNIQPEGAVRSGARWRFAGPYNWYNSGETATGITTGQRELEFHDAGASWERPPNQTVNIAGGQTASVTVTYQPASGTLNVTIEPNEAIRAGAQWKVGDRPWKRSGESERLPVGQHRIEVSPSQGWALSAFGPVNITAGQQTRATVTLRRVEAPLSGGQLRVKIEPQEAVAAGARWRADGGPWQDSNVPVPGLSAGQHRVEYKNIDKWTAPPPATVNVPAGGSANATGRYNRR